MFLHFPRVTVTSCLVSDFSSGLVIEMCSVVSVTTPDSPVLSVTVSDIITIMAAEQCSSRGCSSASTFQAEVMSLCLEQSDITATC